MGKVFLQNRINMTNLGEMFTEDDHGATWVDESQSGVIFCWLFVCF